MKINSFAKIAVLLLAALPVLFSACIKDSCKQTRSYTWYEPVYKTKDEVRANIKSNPAKEVNQPGKLYIQGNYIFLNDVDKGIHIIDNSNPSQPRNVSFIDIPGNLDIAVKGNTLYADLFTDLVTIDITNPLQVVVKKVTNGIFPYRYWGGGFVGNNDMIITDWVRHDTTVTESCDNGGWWGIRRDVFLANASGGPSAGGSSPTKSIGGSMARFAILGERLYTMGMSDLDVFNISNTNDPFHTRKINVGWNIETLYPFKGKLFVGAQAGVYMYSVANPDNPVLLSQVIHPVNTSCIRDPVVADDNYMYETRRTQTFCDGVINKLYVMSIANPASPVLLKTYEMKNPFGLSIDGNYLFVCDDGLKVYNTSNVNNLQLLKQIKDIETYDVIAYNNKALVVAKDGLYQFDYSDINNIRQLSKIAVNH